MADETRMAGRRRRARGAGPVHGAGQPGPRKPGPPHDLRPRSVHRLRWVFQLFFLLLFLGLLTAAFWPVFSGLVSGFLLADPLIALSSAAHGLFRWQMLLAVPVFLSPLFLGRVFCGYACPMGFLIELTGPKGGARNNKATGGAGRGRGSHDGAPGGEGPERGREGRAAGSDGGARASTALRKVPLFGLVVVMVFILLGSAWFLVADPISLFTRSATTLLYPAVDRLLTWGGDLLYRVHAFQAGVDSVTNALTGRLVFANGLHYALQILILVIFVAVLGFSWIERRLWCRHLCPLGALLGLMGRAALFGRVVDESKCTSCKACVKACPMDAIRDDGRTTDMSRCECGLECADVCRQRAVTWGYKPRKQFAYDPGRRALLVGAAAAFAGSFTLFKGLEWARANAGAAATTTTTGAPAAATTTGAALTGAAGSAAGAGAGGTTATGRAGPIRPPGSLAEAAFLATCSRCDECLKVCPTNVLQPAAFEAGLEGVFTPVMNFQRGYCEWTCAECGKVCPTRSIRPLELSQKQSTVMGVAVIDHSLCLPWAKATGCLVCEELCPIPQKAVVFDIAGSLGAGDAGAGGSGTGARGPAVDGGAATGESATDSDQGSESESSATGLKLPRILDRQCTGCGICQYNCPVQGPAAITVRSLPETTRGTV